MHKHFGAMFAFIFLKTKCIDLCNTAAILFIKMFDICSYFLSDVGVTAVNWKAEGQARQTQDVHRHVERENINELEGHFKEPVRQSMTNMSKPD